MTVKTKWRCKKVTRGKKRLVLFIPFIRLILFCLLCLISILVVVLSPFQSISSSSNWICNSVFSLGWNTKEKKVMPCIYSRKEEEVFDNFSTFWEYKDKGICKEKQLSERLNLYIKPFARKLVFCVSNFYQMLFFLMHGSNARLAAAYL